MNAFLSGLGYCSLLTTTFVAIYYMVIIAWVIFYMWTAFFPSLIWGNCDSELCYPNEISEIKKCLIFVFRFLEFAL